MGLYQKHRPKTFKEVKGNKNVVLSLKRLLKDLEKAPHVYLFYGKSGTGKTTLARIVASKLNCTPENVIEIDSAQFNGIDTVRDIKKNAPYVPIGGGSRVIIIDEVQKMTKDAQNAFLKLLEDTPSHLYFILCTTDPQTLLPTIKGRCSQYQTTPLEDEEMMELLTEVVDKEGDEVDEEVLNQIIIDSQGQSRNALTILEQVLATPSKRRLAVAKKSAEQQSEAIHLCRALLNRKGWNTIKEILSGLKHQEPETIRRIVLGYANSVLLGKGGKMDYNAFIILECFEEPFYNVGFPGLTLACYRAINYE